MKITVICVGKIKEDFYRKAVSEYEKRLGRYCKLEIIEVQDEKTPDNASPALEEQIKEKDYTHGLKGNTLLYGIAFRNKRPTVVSERIIL